MILEEISEKLQAGKSKEVETLVQTALEEGIAPAAILSDGLLAGMAVISEKFKAGTIFVPNVLVAARSMNKGMDIIKPLLIDEETKVKGKAVIGTVQGDLHDIGKNLCKMMLEGKGFEVIDLGCDVPAETFIETAIRENCQVIGCSALLSTTMPVMKKVVDLCIERGIREKVYIMIGGAPVSEEYCKLIGADCYTKDAATCADYAASFVNEL